MNPEMLNKSLAEGNEREGGCAVLRNWHPRWTVDVGGERLGITMDDGCLVVLYQHGDNWRPGTHIPRAVASRLSEFSKFLPND